MKHIITAAIIASGIALTALPASAGERVNDALMGAGSGALVGGPVGAVAGGVIGYTAGPHIGRSLGFRNHHRYHRYHRRHYSRN